MKNFAHYLLILLSIILISYISYEKYEDYQAKNYNLEAFPKAIRIEVPANFDFAGEKVPTYETEVRERFDRELYVNIYWQAQTGLIIKRVNRWFPQIEKILKEEGVPDDFKYIAVIESDLRNVVSPVGATGFWQFMEGTGKEFDGVIKIWLYCSMASLFYGFIVILFHCFIVGLTMQQSNHVAIEPCNNRTNLLHFKTLRFF